MLRTIAERISSQISGITQKVIPLAKQLTNSDGKTFPAIYKGQGQYSEISPDNYAGLCYIRQIAPTTISENTEFKRAMNDVSDYRYNLRLVACIKNSVFGSDDSFTSDVVALSLVKLINDSDFSLKADLNANFASVKAVSYNTDVKNILTKEYSGIDRLKNSVPYDFTLIAIDIEVIVTISSNCIELLCKSYCND